MQPKELILIVRHKIITYHCATIFVFQRSLQVLHRQVIKCHCGSSTNWTLQLIALFVQVISGIVLNHTWKFVNANQHMKKIAVFLARNA